MSGGGSSRRGGGGGLRAARIAGGRSNRIQGSVTAGLSSSVLDAKPYSLDGTETPDPDYLTWSSGVSIGGPLGPAPTRSPGALVSTGRRAASLSISMSAGASNCRASTGAVPTSLERNGNFSQTAYTSGPLAGTAVAIYDPLTDRPMLEPFFRPVSWTLQRRVSWSSSPCPTGRTPSSTTTLNRIWITRASGSTCASMSRCPDRCGSRQVTG